MIKKLKRRFLFYSLLSFVSVMLIVLVSVNVTNLVNVNNSLKDSAERVSVTMKDNIATGNGPVRPETPPLDGVPPEGTTIPEIDTTDENTRDFSAGPLARFVMYNSLKDTYNYTFYGAIVDEDEITTTITYLNSLDKEEGRYGNYYFKKDGNYLYLLDATDRVDNLNNVLIISIYVFFGAFLLVAVLMYFASNRVIRPFLEASKKQKEFITNAGHELKTPLTIINTDNTLIEMDFGENEQTRSITRQVNRLTSLTNDLVSLSRLDEGVALNKKELNLGTVINDLVLDFSIEAKAKNKELSVETNDFNYVGDLGLIKKLISILIDNALKYADSNSIIFLKQENSTITVSNNATGLAQGDMSRFFERFYRADESRNSKIRGHGIGLSLAKSIVELHKGKIEASESSNGIFTIKVSL